MICDVVFLKIIGVWGLEGFLRVFIICLFFRFYVLILFYFLEFFKFGKCENEVLVGIMLVLSYLVFYLKGYLVIIEYLLF